MCIPLTAVRQVILNPDYSRKPVHNDHKRLKIGAFSTTDTRVVDPDPCSMLCTQMWVG
jgi:hypothetical protein